MKGINILVIDPNKDVDELNKIFSEVDHKIVSLTKNNKEALKYLDVSSVSADLIFIDPKLGLEVLNLVSELNVKGINVPIAFANENNINALKNNPSDLELVSGFQLETKGQEELRKLKKSNEMAQMQIEELMQTQQHLITATWRERELKEELSKTKGLVEEKNKKILDSINYAKRIQKAIIPKADELYEALGDYFMFYKPKDTVSGDFPWLFVRDKYVYIAAVDCTGHGVPGAMMSLIGFLLLNNVMGNHKDPLPSQILNELHNEVVNTLRQNDAGNSAADGMDVAICRIDKSTGEVMYSGAHRPLYHCIDSEIIQYKGDKYPVGGMQYKGKNTFTDSEIKVNKGESIYFFSDGLPDQFGGPEKLKFGPKRIRNIITDNSNKPMKEQGEIFVNTFDEWKGLGGQIDDILLLGVKF